MANSRLNIGTLNHGNPLYDIVNFEILMASNFRHFNLNSSRHPIEWVIPYEYHSVVEYNHLQLIKLLMTLLN